MKAACYPTLATEMAKRGIAKNQIYQAIGISCKTFYNKLNGITPFTWDEVSEIRKRFFPDMLSDDLFARE